MLLQTVVSMFFWFSCICTVLTETLPHCKLCNVLFLIPSSPLLCQSDVGGQRTLQRRWTTFAKAQLLCQADSELPYNVIQDIDSLPPAQGAPADDTLFYGLFISQW